MEPRKPGGDDARDQLCDLLVSLVDHVEAMLAYWNADEVCLFANQAYHGWFGKTREQIVGHSLRELLGPLYILNEPYIRAAYAGQRQVFERDIPSPDGQLRHSLATYIPDIVDGHVRGIFVHVADVGPLKRLERELTAAIANAEHLATHDFLTGLPNRVLLRDRLEQAALHAERNGEMFAVVSIDLDGFKAVNDAYGHAEGDRLLIEVARRMTASLRESDTVTRLGGDEFLLLAGDVRSIGHARTVAEHVLASVAQPFEVGGTRILPMASLGIALFPADGTTPDVLIAGSDRALYAAKRGGGGRFAFATSPGRDVDPGAPPAGRAPDAGSCEDPDERH